MRVCLNLDPSRLPGEIGVMAALANDQGLLVDLHDTARPSRPWTASKRCAMLDISRRSRIDGIFTSIGSRSGVVSQSPAAAPI